MTSSFARKVLLKTLAGLKHGSLKLIHGSETFDFGDAQSDLRACVMVHDERFFSRVLFGGEDGAGDSYAAGDWSSPDVVAVIRLSIRNLAQLQRGNFAMSWLSRQVNRMRHLRRGNSVEGSRRNIHEHYDLSNDFFRLFLDERMVYSSAIFETADTALEAAQVEKIDRMCRKLRLQPGDEVLEIGTGWGAFALHASREYGARVTTTTISRQQYDYSRELFARSGEAGSRITLLLEDYRNLKGKFDHIASIEMFEAVGLEHYDEFFGACNRLLSADGAMAMQTITMNEHGFAAYHRSSDWIQRRIFPGSELASIREVISSLVRATRMSLYGMEDIGMHYARTLAEWRRRFLERREAVRQLGFDENFLRMWDYYLAYCEGGFRERYVSDVQLLITKCASPRALYGEPATASARHRAAATA
jgi:cyclopropane-fatty-acyl-phospholipid synthase